MSNVINHQNQNQKHNIISHLAGWLLSKKENPSAGESREKLEPLCITGGNAKRHQLPRKMIGNVLKKKNSCHMSQQLHSRVFIQKNWSQDLEEILALSWSWKKWFLKRVVHSFVSLRAAQWTPLSVSTRISIQNATLHFVGEDQLQKQSNCCNLDDFQKTKLTGRHSIWLVEGTFPNAYLLRREHGRLMK